MKNSKLENFEMAKGKKGKKNSNLTDEERFQKEQEKAAAEEAERIGMGTRKDTLEAHDSWTMSHRK